MTAEPDTSKKDAGYGPGKEASHCGNCAHYRPAADPFAVGLCNKVTGGILWYRWCKFWTALAK